MTRPPVNIASLALLTLCLAVGGLNAQQKTATGAPRTATVQSTTRVRTGDSAIRVLSKALTLTNVQAQIRPTMPPLIGLTEAQARTRLSVLTRYMRLSAPPATTARDTIDSTLDGRVFAQSPDAGTLITSQTVIRLGVYRFVPNQSVVVPSVVKLSLDQALRTLAAVPLSWQVPTLSPAERSRAIVIDQRPAGNTKAHAGDPVYLRVQVRSSTTVPYVIGMDRGESARALKLALLTPSEQQPEYSEMVPAGRILRQHPDSGQPAEIGSAVALWYSLGKHPPAPSISTPDLSGRTLIEASRALDSLSLKLGHVDEVPSRTALGRVFAQQPAPRTPLHAGDPVDVRVALPPPRPRVRVPWVGGLDQQRAERVLIDSGFVPRVTSVLSSRARGDSVVSQRPDSGIVMPLKSIVDITVERPAATPPRSVDMPSVLGAAEAEARDRLGFLSPRITVVWHDTSDRSQHGRVTDQDPDPGTPVVPGVGVTLTLGRFTPPGGPIQPPASATPIQVPFVRGLRFGDAVSAIATAHLRLGDVIATDVGLDSVVAEQRPPGGTSVDFNTPVDLTLQERVVISNGEPPNWMWLVIVAGLVAIAATLTPTIRQWMRDRHTNRPTVKLDVELKSPDAPSPKIDVNQNSTIVAHHVALVWREPQVVFAVQHSVIAHEERIDEQQR